MKTSKNINGKLLLLLFFTIIFNNLFSQESTEKQCEREHAFLYYNVDVLPKFNYKKMDLYYYIYSNLHCHEKYVDISGTVIASFIVNKNGKICDVWIERRLYEECDNEIRRILLSMPNWEAGEKNGQKVNTIMFLPISFALK
jgi:hypothetical protein